MADSQFKEINRLKEELQSSQIQRKNSFHNNVSQDFENQLCNIQKQMEVETDKYKEKCQLLEENEQELTDILKNKGKLF